MQKQIKYNETSKSSLFLPVSHVSQECINPQCPERIRRIQAEKHATWEREQRIRLERELAKERQHKQQHKQLWRTELKPAEKAILTEFQRQIDSPNSHKDEQGRTRITFKTAGINTGMTAKSAKHNWNKIIEQCPDLLALADATVITKQEYDEELKRNTPRLYIEARRSLVDAAIHSGKSNRIRIGGNRYSCMSCGSDNVVIKRTLVCCDCGHTSELDTTRPNGTLNNTKDAEHNRTSLAAPPSLMQKEQNITEPALSHPPQSQKILPMYGKSVDVSITIDPPIGTTDFPHPPIVSDEIQEAAVLLVSVSGIVQSHLMMVPSEKKYLTINKPLTVDDAIRHFRGGHTVGVSKFPYDDGRTRAVCYDADSSASTELLLEAGHKLANAGYVPLLEKSPAKKHLGGSHLWIIFDDLVDVSDARARMLQIAPELAEVEEYWPRGSQGMRLLGGKYVNGGVDEWCKLINIATGETASDGIGAAVLLLTSLTSSSVINLPVAQAEVDFFESAMGEERERQTTRYFEFSPSYVAQYFNDRHQLTDILPLERNGKALSPNGDERTASVSYHNERFYDHSLHGRRADGTCDSGDAFELACKVWQMSKSELLRQTAREIIAHALSELEVAAYAGKPIPPHLESIITPSGRVHYLELFVEPVKPRYREGDRVVTPQGEIGTIGIISEDRCVCRVLLQNRQSDGTFYAAFHLEQLSPIVQSRLM